MKDLDRRIRIWTADPIGGRAYFLKKNEKKCNSSV
jgi:hypothetical protein